MTVDAKLPDLPPGFSVRSEGQGEERRVVLDIEGTTFELHPRDSRAVGAHLLAKGADAEEHENG